MHLCLDSGMENYFIRNQLLRLLSHELRKCQTNGSLRGKPNQRCISYKNFLFSILPCTFTYTDCSAKGCNLEYKFHFIISHRIYQSGCLTVRFAHDRSAENLNDQFIVFNVVTKNRQVLSKILVVCHLFLVRLFGSTSLIMKP